MNLNRNSAQNSAPANSEAGTDPSDTSPPADDPQARQLDSCQKEKAELYDRLLRKQAEFDNYRKRQDREKKEIPQTVRAEVIREFLPVADACERALKALAETEHGIADTGSFREGIELIYRQFLDTLARFDVLPIDAVGQQFDPAKHHAIMREETDQHPENQVVEELQKGYTVENRLLRPSQVKVAIPPSKR
jgi:molecular chaperone GrpE